MTIQETAIKTIIDAVVGGGVGAFAAFLFTKLHWRQTERSRKLEASLAHLKRENRRVEDLAVQYWLSEDTSRSPENRQIEIQLKTLLRAQVKTIKMLDDDQKQILSKIHSELFEIVTGDYFESSQRASNPKKSQQIAQKCSEFNYAITQSLFSKS